MKKKKPLFKFNILVWFLLRKLGNGPLMLRFHPKSDLLMQGWFRAFRRNLPVDGEGHPIPFWPYSVIHFLEERLNDSMRVLEFGCGYSTIWLSRRTKQVISLENNIAWQKRISHVLPANASVVYLPHLESFSIEGYHDFGRFDVIVIDAKADRLKCASRSIDLLTDTGVVIWDDTNGPDWPSFKAVFQKMGFREISFTGLSAGEIASHRTTIFYRSDNCLGI